MTRALLTPLAALLLPAAPVLAAEQILPQSIPERIAFGVVLVGTIAFFGWVAWLARRR